MIRHPRLLILDTMVSRVPGTVWWVIIGYSVGADRYLTMVSLSLQPAHVSDAKHWQHWSELLLTGGGFVHSRIYSDARIALDTKK